MVIVERYFTNLNYIPFSQEIRTSRQRQLATDERQCRSYLTLASETLGMLHYLTQEIKEPFVAPVSSFLNLRIFSWFFYICMRKTVFSLTRVQTFTGKSLSTLSFSISPGLLEAVIPLKTTLLL